MNKKSLSVVILFLASVFGLLLNPSSVRSQYILIKDYQSPTLIGVRVGASIASESFSEIPGGASAGLKFGLTGGLDLEHWFGDKWAISTGLLFEQKGVNQQYAPSSSERGTAGHDTSGNDNFTMNYFEVPVILKMSFGFGNVRPFLFAGPTFGFLASASETTDGSIPPVSNLKSYIQSTDVSIYFGGGVMDRIDRGPALLFDAGYETGLTKAFKSEPPRAFTAPFALSSATSSEIIITIGLLWGL